VPANLTPEYLKAEKWFRQASTPDEKILALEEMLRTIPKHKGTDHMQADIKRRLSKLRQAAETRKTAKTVDFFYIPKSGAGQVVLIGTPSCGKSSIVGALTNAKVSIADFPFATATPVPGMVKFEDIQIQLIDMPPITADFAPPGIVSTYRSSDLIGIVIDLSADVLEQMQVCIDFLESHRLLMDNNADVQDTEGNTLARPTFVICSKADIAPPDALEKIKKNFAGRFEFVEVSTQNRLALDNLVARMYQLLKIVRVYTKKPGKKADLSEPFTLPAGSTVMNLATAIHRELAEKFRYARIWGTGVHDGQNVQKNHILNDKDIIELHFS